MTRNAYCERLGIDVPALERFVEGPRPTLLSLMVLALLEHGSPLSVEEIADRLLDAGVRAPSGDMVYSLRRAWHGLAPVVKEPDGSMGLDLESWHLRCLVSEFGLKKDERPPADVDLPPPAPEMPSDDVPLREAEVGAALGKPGLSNVRTVAAVLDVHAGALSYERVRETVQRLTGTVWEPHRPFARNRLFSQSSDGLLTPGGDRSELLALRRLVRAAAREAWHRKAVEEHEARRRLLYLEARQERQRREAAEAAGLRKALVWALPREDRPEVVTVLDLRSREIRSFSRPSLGAAVAALKVFDVVYGLDLRTTLAMLGLDARDFRAFELGPPRKNVRLNKSGRKLQVTPEMVISSSTGIVHPLADPAKVARYLAEGDTGKLVRRAESDVKSLYALYRYGVLHGHVRLRWGFVDEVFGVDWELPDDQRLHEVLRTAVEEGRSVDLVVGNAPGWTDPWSRAFRARVVDVGYHDVLIDQDGLQRRVSLDEVQAVRLAGAP